MSEQLQVLPEIYPFDEVVLHYASMPEANFQSYEHMKPDESFAIHQRDMFLASRVENPVIRLSDESIDGLKTSTRRLEQILGLVEQNTFGEINDREALYEVVAERLAAHYFILQAHRVEGMNSQDPTYAYEVERLQDLNNALHGLPDKQDFDSLLAQELTGAYDALEMTDEPEVKKVIEEYLALLPRPTSQSDLYLPSEDTVAHYSNLIKRHFSKILQDINLDNDAIYVPEAMIPVFERALYSLEIEDWGVQIEKGGTVINVDQEKKLIKIGSERKPARGRVLAGLVLHEAGVHVSRRHSGEQTGNPLLWNLGLANYYENEEGLGKFVEQALANKPKVAGVGHYINAGLSLGIDGKPRDFREVFEIEWRATVVSKIKAGKTIDEKAVIDAQKSSYNRVMRIRRGMPGHVKGVAFTKDLSYFNGTATIWKYMEDNIDNPHVLVEVLLGKHDPTRADHRAIVRNARQSMR